MLPPYIEEHPVAFAIIISSPNNCVKILIYDGCPHPRHAPGYLILGVLNWLDKILFFESISLSLIYFSKYSNISCSFSNLDISSIIKALLFLSPGHALTHKPHPVQFLIDTPTVK